MGYLSSASYAGEKIATLTNLLLTISIAVVVIIAVLTLSGVVVRREPTGELRADRVARTPGGLEFIIYGVGISTLVLFILMLWTVYTMAAIHTPRVEPKIAIEVTGHQWWWEVRYLDSDPSRTFTTANEIHIPTNEPVRFILRTADVIHSFWIPKLSGKTDMIPNQTNESWLEAGAKGVYRGQCTEFCGQQHAHMSLLVIADTPPEFESWRNKQLASAKPAEGEQAKARDAFVAKCGICHTVRGTLAGGKLGPDLSHIASRHTIAANTLPNTAAHLTGWIADPQSVKPGSKMPVLDLSGPDLTSIRKYLETLE